ncbi:RDD family protein [Chitinimonas naiadis]
METDTDTAFNPYSASLAAAPAEQAAGNELANRWVRLGAAVIDGVILMAASWLVLGGAMFVLIAYFSALQDYVVLLGILILLTGWGMYLAINGYLLHTRGQTVGKRLVGIRVVRSNGERASLANLILRRYLPFYLLGLLPFLGMLIILVDVLFIFGKDQRCLHDMLADTKVVMV